MDIDTDTRTPTATDDGGVLLRRADGEVIVDFCVRWRGMIVAIPTFSGWELIGFASSESAVAYADSVNEAATSDFTWRFGAAYVVRRGDHLPGDEH